MSATHAERLPFIFLPASRGVQKFFQIFEDDFSGLAEPTGHWPVSTMSLEVQPL